MHTDNTMAAVETEVKADGSEASGGVNVKHARNVLGDLVSQVSYGNKRIVPTKHGKRAAALVSMADLERLKQLDLAAQPAA